MLCPLPVPTLGLLLRSLQKGFCGTGKDSTTVPQVGSGTRAVVSTIQAVRSGDPSFGNLPESQPHMYRSTITNIVRGVTKNPYIQHHRKIIAKGRKTSVGGDKIIERQNIQNIES